MVRFNYLDNFEVGDILKLQVSGIGQKGLFLIDSDQNKEHEVFIPFYEVKENLNKYDYVYVGVDVDSKGKKVVTAKLEDVIPKYARKALSLKRGDKFYGVVYNVIEYGAFAVNEDKVIGFIHEEESDTNLKVGNKVEGRITFIREDGRVNLSLRPLKEVGRVTDAEKILEFIKGRKGMMPYSDETPPEVIKDKFGISKSAFKRALGKLIKDNLVEQREGWTYLRK